MVNQEENEQKPKEFHEKMKKTDKSWINKRKPDNSWKTQGKLRILA